MARFATDQMCRDYLVQSRWNGRPECPQCSNNHLNYYLKSRNTYKCSNCYKQFNVLQNTIFYRSKISLPKWFLAIYLFTVNKRGISSCQLAKTLGIKQHSAWYMLQRLREAMKEENNIVLSGIVEADETLVGPRIDRDKRLKIAKAMHEKEQDRIHGISKYKREKLGIKLKQGRKAGSTKEILHQKSIERDGEPYSSKRTKRAPFEKGAMILGMVERDGKIVMKKIGTSPNSVTKWNVYPHLIKHIKEDSVLVTDQASVYKKVKGLFAEHQSVNHKVGYVINGIHSNTIENVWKHLKKMISGTYFHLSYHHFDGYLNESTYRWNRRDKSERILFEDFIPLLVGKGISYKKLTEKGENKIAA